ncbi:MAG TPA: tetratricopeptide repeat protein [Pyrinomonadaceae bacterium]|jgi:tetratricopeptide (TPR) repeat protein|nr:tetratricopeptide repeat protein [Pyrinomonadaceae bacterium]
MDHHQIFISHASKDDDFVAELREALENQNLLVWVDSRHLRGGSKLAPEITEAIEQARHFIAVISTNTINSPWVRKEIQKAVEVEAQRKDEGYRVIPLLLPGVEPSALPLWFDEEPVGVRVELQAGGLSEALPDILAALGERLPTDHQLAREVAARPVEELNLKLAQFKIETKDGKRRAQAVAQIVYEPADKNAREVESRPFIFTAPLGVIETEDVRWYLEDYVDWPIGVFKERAARIETQLPVWGQELYRAAMVPPAAQETVNAWQQSGLDGERRFSVFVDSALPDGASEEEQAAAGEAATELLSLPWELLHDGRGFLFHGKHPVRVRRRLPNRHSQPVRPTRLPIRILLVSPRPEDENTTYFDHRISARPLVEAVENLGQLAKLSVLTPPTFPALEETLLKADEAEEPFDVIHFDGHGVYDPTVGLGGALCFEDPNETQKLEGRVVELIHAGKLAEVIRDHRIPLVFLEACQSAKTEADPTASVAAKLLEEGVTSVVAMSHSVLVETAHRFVKAFYTDLAQGKRVGAAMLAGQRELHRDSYRGKLMGAGELRLQDWFVPVLYQEEQDPQLINRLQPKEVQQLQAAQRRLSFGALPDPPPHEFQGRSRELLVLERLLHAEPYAVVRGQGGAGKTTLAVELVRWLVRVGRFRRAAFVSMDQYTDARSVLDSLGRQLLPEGENWSVAQYTDIKQALQPVERALADRPTIILLDNLESVLHDHTGQSPPGAAPVEELFALCRELQDADPATRILFTSRESLPAPFNHGRREIRLGALSREDAIKLVAEVMKQEGLTPKSEDPGGDPQEIVDLVEAVNRHARALVLLARELPQGVRATTQKVRELMERLDREHPGDRQNSLYASVELSLRRLSQQTREQIKPLAVFHGGAHFYVFNHMLGKAQDDMETAPGIFRELVEVGLGEDMGYGHLRLDPALPPYLLREMSEPEQAETSTLWADGMKWLTQFLYDLYFKNAEVASQLTLLEMPNLMSMLRWMQEKAAPEEVVIVANKVEALLSYLGRGQALAEVTRVREQAASELKEWSHARYLTEDTSIDRLLESGDLSSAHTAAQQLRQRSLAAGEGAYPGADYDIAMAHVTLGRVLKRGGAAEEALTQLAEGRRRFQALADEGDTSAEGPASVAITESGDCLRDLGRLDEAAEAYQEAIRRNEKLEDQRAIAVSKGQLGTVRLLQGQYEEALEIYTAAKDIFASMGEPGSVATLWHQIGVVHRYAGQYEQAERAYRQSLAIAVQQKNLSDEGLSMGELGNLYDALGRLEESVRCYLQAADIYIKLQDQRYEGVVRNNLANTLIKLQRYDDARRELLRAIECKKPYGHAAESWKTWAILYNLEQATNQVEAAGQARQQAIESYLSYRRAGGQNMSQGDQLCTMTAQAIKQGETTKAEQALAKMTGADVSPSVKVLISRLESILRGERNPALADDPDLYYRDAVELRLLLEVLGE